MKYKFLIYQDKKKEYRWKLVSSNGRIIADGAEGYKRKFWCKKQAASIAFTHYSDFRVIDATKKP